MASGFHQALHLMRRLVQRNSDDAVSDQELLARYIQDHDEAAFDLLVQRHGAMVLAVCRKLLHDPALIEDAFQATFLVLVKRAGSLRWHGSVAGWLHEVAGRVSRKANTSEARRCKREREAAVTTEAPMVENASVTHEALHEELGKLPDKYRAPLVLCYFEGKTNEEAALELGIGTSAVKMRVSRGRDKLRDRLGRRGVSLTPAALIVLLLEQAATAAVPTSLAVTTARVALQMATGQVMADTTEFVSNLMEGVVRDMLNSKIRRWTITAGIALLAIAGAGALGLPSAKNKVAAGPPPLKLEEPDQTVKARVVAGNTAFATDLYDRLRKEEGNVLFSPYSISTALAMTYAGARGETETEMTKALHFGLPQEKLHPGFRALIKDTNGDGKDRGFKLAVANRLWGQKGCNFRPDYLEITENQYGARLHEVDFMTKTEEARGTINRWVEEKTENKIKELLAEGVLTEDSKLVLTNAIYFKGNWQTQFDKKLTSDRPFQLGKDGKKKVPFMHVKSEFGLGGDAEVDVLEMPYKNKELSMVIYLPKKADGLAEFEKGLTSERIVKLFPKGKQEVIVNLPRFKFTAEFALKPTLESMGMKQAFTDKADFSGLRSERDVWLSAVIHKAFIEVNEEGTEAAAATAVPGIAGGIGLEPDPVFHADHPFLFLIKDNKTNSILFMGRVVDPTQS